MLVKINQSLRLCLQFHWTNILAAKIPHTDPLWSIIKLIIRFVVYIHLISYRKQSQKTNGSSQAENTQTFICNGFSLYLCRYILHTHMYTRGGQKTKSWIFIQLLILSHSLCSTDSRNIKVISVVTWEVLALERHFPPKNTKDSQNL